MQKATVHNLSEYVQIISEHSQKLIRNGMDCHEILLFRGHSNINYQLIPSLGRNRETCCDISIFNEERNLIELAKYKLPNVFRNDLLPIELLALLQHHGIPTRLLDVTESALVALYFACCSNHDKDKDGEVIVFKNNDKDVANYPVINAIADSYRFARGTFYPLSLFYRAVITQPYFSERKLVNEFRTEKEGGEWIKRCCSSPMFVYAPNHSLRQQMQRGRYILFPNQIEPYGTEDEFCFETIIKPIPKDHETIAGCITIPKECKKQFLTDLAVMGISREMLFADNIDIVCESIVEACKYRVAGDW